MFKELFTPLIPDNIKNIKIVSDSIDVFLDVLIKHSDISIDMFNMFDENKKNIFEEYIKIYNRAVYDLLKKIPSNNALREDLKRIYKIIGKDFDVETIKLNVLDIINKEHLYMNRYYKQSKGKEDAIRYVYNLAYNLNIQPNEIKNNNYFKYEEGPGLFEYKVEGELLPEIFEAIVKPLSHPMGWIVTYKRMLENSFKDYFKIKITYDIKKFYVGTKLGDVEFKDDFVKNKGLLFDYNLDGIKKYKTPREKEYNYKDYFPFLEPHEVGRELNLFEEYDFLNNENIVLNGINYPLSEHNFLVYDNKVVFIEKLSEGENKITRVYFKSGEILESQSYPRKIRLLWGSMAPSDFNGLNDSEDINIPEVIKDYRDINGHSGLVLEYDYKIESSVEEKAKFLIRFGTSDTPCNKLILGSGNVFLGSHSDSEVRLGDKTFKENIAVTQKSYVNSFRPEKGEIIEPLKGALSDFEMDIPSNNIFATNYNTFAKTLNDIKDYNFNEKQDLEKLNSITLNNIKKLEIEKENILRKMIIEDEKYREIEESYNKLISDCISIYKDFNKEVIFNHKIRSSFWKKTITRIDFREDETLLFFDDNTFTDPTFYSEYFGKNESFKGEFLEFQVSRFLAPYETYKPVFDEYIPEHRRKDDDLDLKVYQVRYREKIPDNRDEPFKFVLTEPKNSFLKKFLIPLDIVKDLSDSEIEQYKLKGGLRELYVKINVIVVFDVLDNKGIKIDTKEYIKDSYDIRVRKDIRRF